MQYCSNSNANTLELLQCCDGLVQDFSNSIASALELLQYCTKPWAYFHNFPVYLSAGSSWVHIVPGSEPRQRIPQATSGLDTEHCGHCVYRESYMGICHRWIGIEITNKNTCFMESWNSDKSNTFLCNFIKKENRSLISTFATKILSAVPNSILWKKHWLQL